MVCELCEKRRPKRYCPGIRGKICPTCCGTQREETVRCPLDCTYLQDARRHEKLPGTDPSKLPSQDIQVTESFLREHEDLTVIAGRILKQAGLTVRDAVDADVEEALAALVQTYRTRQSGLIYHTRPANFIAAAICDNFTQGLEEFLRLRRRQLGMETIRDSDLLGVLVFYQRAAHLHNNGRRWGRAFLHLLATEFPDAADAGAPATREYGVMSRRP